MANKTEDLKVIQITESVLLKEIEFSDASDIFSTIDSQREYLGKCLPFVDKTKEIADSQNFIKSVSDTPSENREYTFVIHYNGVFAGVIGFKNTDKLNKRTEIGYWLSEPFQKLGIITASVQKLMQFAYDDLGMNRIQIKCAVDNIPSRNIPRKLGYTFEGIERAGELLSGGVFTDIEVYSKLKND